MPWSMTRSPDVLEFHHTPWHAYAWTLVLLGHGVAGIGTWRAGTGRPVGCDAPP